MAEFKDWQEAMAWLATQPSQTRVWFGTRSALRVFPIVGYEQTHNVDRISMLMLRCIVSAYAHIKQADVSLRNERMEFNSLRELADSINPITEAVVHAKEAADSALSANSSFSSAFCIEHSTRAASLADALVAELPEYPGIAALRDSASTPDRILEASNSDAKNAGNEHPLWYNDAAPFPLSVGLTRLLKTWEDRSQTWSFWAEWYQGFLNGNPIDWDLQIRVAKIDNAIWIAGPEAVAEEIAKIRARFDLEKRIEALQVERGLLLSQASRHGIGGNNPPEDMQIEPQIVRETTIIWAAVEDLKAETEKETPGKSTVLRIIETLGRALKAILAWCAQKGDLSVDTLIKWGIPLGGAAVLANPKLVADVIEAAKAWVPYLP